MAFYSLLATMPLVLGCGDDRGLVNVSGKVTMDGGPPPAAGDLYFNIVDPAPGFSGRPAHTTFDEQGNYSVSAFGDDQGILPGKYKVKADCWKVPPLMGGPPPVSFLPKKYQNAATSGFELTVNPGDDAITFDIDLTSE